MSGVSVAMSMSADNVVGFLTRLGSAFPAAAATALNRTGEIGLVGQAQKVQDGRMHIRQPKFDVPPTIIPTMGRATPGKLQAVIAFAYGTDNPGSIGSKAERALEPYGVAQTIRAQNPMRPFFAPTTALRSSVDALVKRSAFPDKLIGDLAGGGRAARVKMTRRKIARKGMGAIMESLGVIDKAYRTTTGKQVASAFVLGEAGKKYFGIWERVGPSRDAIVMLWYYLEQKNDPKLLDFQADIEAVLAANWPQQMGDAMQAALAGVIS